MTLVPINEKHDFVTIILHKIVVRCQLSPKFNFVLSKIRLYSTFSLTGGVGVPRA